MIDLTYFFIIEATAAPDYFGFFSPELEGFTGIGHSVTLISIIKQAGPKTRK